MLHVKDRRPRMSSNHSIHEKEGASAPPPQGHFEMHYRSPVHSAFKLSLEERLERAEKRRKVRVRHFNENVLFERSKDVGGPSHETNSRHVYQGHCHQFRTLLSQNYLDEIKERVRCHNESILKEVSRKKERHSTDSALDTLNSRLKEAGHKRERYLKSLQTKASLPSQRVEKVLATLESQKLEKERELQESLDQAEKLRQNRLNEASLAAGKYFQQVLEKARQVKEKERLYAEEKMREYHLRQEAAAEARKKLSQSNVGNHSLLTSALSQKNGVQEESAMNVHMGAAKQYCRKKSDASKLGFVEAVHQFYESGIPRMIPTGMQTDKSLQNSLSELSESLSSMDSGKAPVPMLHQVSVAMDGDELEKSMLFDDFAELIADPRVLKCVQRILHEMQSVHEERIGSATSQRARYPSRVFLAAYMITNYPEVVLSGVGAQEVKLTDSALQMITTFDEIVRESTRRGGDIRLVSSAVETFDSMWMLYHDQFKIWKSHDAAGLEADLIKAAVELELSRLKKLSQATEKVRHQVDIEALSEAVDHDLNLIEERIATLTGDVGVVRLRAALEAIKSEIQVVDEGVGNSTSSHSSPVKKLQRTLHDRSCDSSDSEASQQAPATEWDNLSLMWNLLYDPNWRLPMEGLEMQWDDAIGKSTNMEGEENANSILMAEKTKWKRIQAHLIDTGTKDRLSIVTEIISEIISKLKSFAPALVTEEFSKEFGSQAGLEEFLLPKPLCKYPLGWIDVENCLYTMEWCSKIVMQLCAPGRDEDILQAHRLVSRQMEEALGQKDYATSITESIVYSLRILKLQTKILSMDLANAHLQAITSRFSRLTPALRIAYARNKLGEELHLPQDTSDNEFDERLKANLSKTRGWLAVASGKLPRLSTFNSSLTTQNCTSSSDGKKQRLPKMKTGFDPSRNYEDSDINSETIHLEKIDSIASWRGLVRVGLVHLISGDGVIGSLSLPETLTRDIPRLFELKNEFQKCMVIAMCMIIIENSNMNDDETSLETLQVQKSAAKTRIQAILNDPNVCLKDISLEVSSCIQSLNPEIENFDELSSHIFNILKALLHRSSQEGRGIIDHLNDMLLSLMTIQNSQEGKDHTTQYISNYCRKIGTPEIAGEVTFLGKHLGRFAAVTEAVCAPWYSHLAKEFLV